MFGATEEVFEEELPLDTVFVLPDGLKEHHVLGRYLIISPTTANWLVLADEAEHSVFCLIKQGKAIGAIVGSSPEITEEKVSCVVAQIVSKDFQATAIVEDKKNLETATIHITNGCNLRCTTCYLKSAIAAQDECTPDEWKSFLLRFKEVGGEVVTISGGEPMTRPDFFEILSYADELELKVVLLTNGTLINEKNVSDIGYSCDEVQISIDGPDKDTNDSIRGKGSFKKATAALIMLKDYPCKLAIAMTPTPKTLPIFKKGLAEFARWARKYVRQDIVFRVTPHLLEGRHIGCLSSEEQSVFHNEVVSVCNDQLQEGWFDMLDAAAIVSNRKTCGCGIGEFFMISHSGDIKTCVFSSESIGSIKHPLCVAVERLNNLRCSFRVENTRPCKDCDLRYFCGGKCRLESVKDDGGLNALSCGEAFRSEWYKRLVRVNPYVFESVSV